VESSRTCGATASAGIGGHAEARESKQPLLRGRERQAFLDSTKRRMRTFTELALAGDDPDRTIRDAAAKVTARPGRDAGAAHEALAQSIRRK